MKQKSLDREDESSVWILVVASFDNDERKPEPLITLAFKSRGDAMYALKKSKKSFADDPSCAYQMQRLPIFDKVKTDLLFTLITSEEDADSENMH